MKTAYLIVGPIGSGKSAITDFVLSLQPLRGLEYVGSDEYKRQFFSPGSDDLKRRYRCADELVFCRIEQLCKTGRDFAFEFCPTNLNKIETLKYLLRKYKYRAVTLFVATERNEINIARCRSREAAGADPVSAEKIRSRHAQALNRALEMVHLSARIYFIDNSLETPKLVATIVDKDIRVTDDACAWFKICVQQKLVENDRGAEQ